MLVDSHCHLDFPELFDNLDNIVENAIKNNVNYLLTISTSILPVPKNTLDVSTLIVGSI